MNFVAAAAFIKNCAQLQKVLKWTLAHFLVNDDNDGGEK